VLEPETPHGNDASPTPQPGCVPTPSARWNRAADPPIGRTWPHGPVRQRAAGNLYCVPLNGWAGSTVLDLHLVWMPRTIIVRPLQDRTGGGSTRNHWRWVMPCVFKFSASLRSGRRPNMASRPWIFSSNCKRRMGPVAQEDMTRRRGADLLPPCKEQSA